MSSLKPDIMINPSDLFTAVSNVAGTVPFTTQIPELGVRAVTGDGREFRYCQNGATALIVGQAIQSAATQANYVGVTAVAVAAGATTATLTVSTSTAVAANQFSGGYYTTYGTVANGGGQILKISSNSAVTASGTSISFVFEEGPSIAITTSAGVSIVPPTYGGVIVSPGTVTGTPAGISLMVANNTSTTLNGLPASYFGWLQVKGVGLCAVSGTPAVGSALQFPVSGTQGELMITSSTAYGDVGTMLIAGTDHRYNPVLLNLA